MAREGPLGEGMDGPAPGLQGGSEGLQDRLLDLLWREVASARPWCLRCWSRLALVFIGESSITYGVLKRRNPLG